MKRHGDLGVDRATTDLHVTVPAEVQRRAAVTITAAHLRGVPGLPDIAALVDVLDALGLMGTGEGPA